MNPSTPHPTALNLPQANPLPADTQAYFDLCEAKLGMVPNVLRAYAHNIDKLNAFSAMYNDLMLGASALSKLEREMIAVVVSAVNRCHYCLVAHGAAVRVLGSPELGEALITNYRVANITPRQRAMLDFSVMMSEASAKIEEADRAALRDHGFTDADIWDIAAVASFYNMTNRMASAIDMRPNAEYHAMAR